jgi:hypothetical protein
LIEIVFTSATFPSRETFANRLGKPLRGAKRSKLASEKREKKSKVESDRNAQRGFYLLLCFFAFAQRNFVMINAFYDQKSTHRALISFSSQFDDLTPNKTVNREIRLGG